MDDSALLLLSVELARRAGEAILEVRRTGFEVQCKADHSPVTAADHAAEAIIVAGLRAAAPDIPVIAEEEVASGRVSAPAACFWLVDPLDGTREFTSGSDEFAVNIGLVRNGHPVIGVVAVPAVRELFWGVAGVGAWKQTPAGEGQISARAPPAEGLTVVASRHHGDVARLAAFLCGRSVAKTRNLGSSLKFCLLAEGAADLYPRFGRTMEWDTCAPHAVLEAAGGRVRTVEGAPLLYGKPGWENPHFICTGKADPGGRDVRSA